MSGFSVLIIIILTLIITFFICKFAEINISLKDMTKQIDEKISGTNQTITTSTGDKTVNALASGLNKELEQIRKKEIDYENSNRELYRTVIDISHDLRTPLTAIKGYAELLGNEEDSEKIKKYADIISRKADTMTDLTRQLFDYAKSLDINESGIKENVCINDVLREILISFYTGFRDKNIDPKINICDRKIYRYLDSSMLIRIFENIISNAIKYSDGNIETGLMENGNIYFRNKASSLDRTSVGRIFDRYFTVENARKNSGVGLSIAKQLTELNGGHIYAEYKEGNLVITLNFDFPE